MTSPVLTKPEKIDMTSPVVTKGDGGGVMTMQFTLPEKYKKAEEAPKPVDERVVIREEGDRKYGVMTFSGVASEGVVAKKVEKLKKDLEGDGFKISGEYVLGRYNPPWITLPTFRTNEVLIPVACISEKEVVTRGDPKGFSTGVFWGALQPRATGETLGTGVGTTLGGPGRQGPGRSIGEGPSDGTPGGGAPGSSRPRDRGWGRADSGDRKAGRRQGRVGETQCPNRLLLRVREFFLVWVN
ncbi:hypothetical protein L6452_42098 [Arctium lappa]|uniref:Uncharacterized protein n=1 Tax=Arctium lappa TaxID=4217 RepID=A0ACB8XIH4_ARCLA|nr:hypothetical protein L6452_42098 [Arctium lappa]